MRHCDSRQTVASGERSREEKALDTAEAAAAGAEAAKAVQGVVARPAAPQALKAEKEAYGTSRAAEGAT